MNEECEGDYIHWIYDWWGDCVVTTRDKVAFAFGLAVTLIWIYAQLPQIILNFRNHSAEAISLPCYLLSASGDLAGLIAVFLSETMVTQKFNACWGVLADTTSTLQYVWYHTVRPWCTGEAPIDPGVDELSPRLDGNPMLPVLPLLMATANGFKSDDQYGPGHRVGMVLAWYSGTDFVFGRSLQVVKNCRRHRTTGLSISFWLLSFSANLCYGISIFVKDPTWTYIWKQFPYLLGSVGCLQLDFTVMMQFLYYRMRKGRRQRMEQRQDKIMVSCEGE